MDTSTYEIMKECNSGCRMAVNSIEQLVAYLKNQELQELLSKYKEDYEKMERESIRLSEGKLQEEKFSEKAAEKQKKLTRIKIRRTGNEQRCYNNQ